MNDLIRRQDAIDAIDELKIRYFDRKVILAKAQDAVNNVPSAQKQGKWVDLIDTFNHELAKIAKDYYDDPENSHYYADILMVDTLKDLGFDLQPFDDMCKWYA